MEKIARTEKLSHGRSFHLLLLVLWISSSSLDLVFSHEFARDGTVIELDESNFDVAIASFDRILVDFYAPWCVHCKRLSPELDAAAPVLAGWKEPIFIAKINADKYRKLASEYEIDGFPALKFFTNGVPIDYTGPRKSELLIKYIKKLAVPTVSLLESDLSVRNFVESADTNFPIFIAFGLGESVISEPAGMYKRKAWFAVAKDFSQDLMDLYNFDKAPALVSINHKYKEQSVFYGPFEGAFLEDFIRQNLLPLAVPINHDTLRLLSDDNRKIVLTIVEDESDDKSSDLIKILKLVASANRDLVFGFVGLKQWEQFADTFGGANRLKLPMVIVWDRNEEYHIVEGLETLKDEDHGSQISRFIELYREGKTSKQRIKGSSFTGFMNSMGITLALVITLMVASVGLILYLTCQSGGDYEPKLVRPVNETGSESATESETQRESHKASNKED